MSVVRGGARLWLLACIGAVACGDDGAGESPVPIAMMDAGMDAGRVDTVDASGDSGPSSALDGGPIAVPKAACVFGNDGVTIVADTFVSPAEALAVSVRNDGALLGWIGFDKGKQRRLQQWYGTDYESTFGAPSLETEQEDSALTSTQTSTGFLSVWTVGRIKVPGTDTVAVPLNLRAQAVNAGGVALGTSSIKLTDDNMDNRGPALATGADGNALVVFHPADQKAAGRSLLLSATGQPLGAAQDIPDYTNSTGRAALAKLGTGFVLVWVDLQTRHVHLQVLTASGAPVGGAIGIDAEGDAQGTVDLATTDSGGAVAFDVLVAGQRPEVRFRAFDLTGKPSGNERVITSFPDTGLVPAIAPMRGGYVIAYRSDAGVDGGLRLALIDRYGAVIAARTMADLVDYDLPVSIGSTPSGEHLFLSWMDRKAETASYLVQRTWIECD